MLAWDMAKACQTGVHRGMHTVWRPACRAALRGRHHSSRVHRSCAWRGRLPGTWQMPARRSGVSRRARCPGPGGPIPRISAQLIVGALSWTPPTSLRVRASVQGMPASCSTRWARLGTLGTLGARSAAGGQHARAGAGRCRRVATQGSAKGRVHPTRSHWGAGRLSLAAVCHRLQLAAGRAGCNRPDLQPGSPPG